MISRRNEGVALGLPAHGVDERFGHLVGGQGLEELSDLIPLESAQHDPLVLHLAAQGGQRLGKGMSTVELHVPIGPDEEEPPPCRESRHVAKQADGSGVRPVEVVEHEQQRAALGGRQQELGRGVVEPCPLLVRLELRQRGEIGKALAQSRDDAVHRRPARAEVLAQRLGIGALQVLGERLGERRVRRLALALETAPVEHAGTATPRARGELLERARLPDARLSHHHDDAPAP